MKKHVDYEALTAFEAVSIGLVAVMALSAGTVFGLVYIV